MRMTRTPKRPVRGFVLSQNAHANCAAGSAASDESALAKELKKSNMATRSAPSAAASCVGRGDGTTMWRRSATKDAGDEDERRGRGGHEGNRREEERDAGGRQCGRRRFGPRADAPPSTTTTSSPVVTRSTRTAAAPIPCSGTL
jgi:hypothetical protein